LAKDVLADALAHHALDFGAADFDLTEFFFDGLDESDFG
jgi:hypothetical protein